MHANCRPISYKVFPDTGVKRSLLIVFLMAVMLIGLPLAGVWFAGYPITRYLEFPPYSQYVQHAPFSWAVFISYAVIICVIILPFIYQAIRFGKNNRDVPTATHKFPWWGWLGVASGLVGWIVAWNRFAWLSTIQPHTFTPLWLSYIVVVNALDVRRSGRCLMTSRPGYFLILFPVSAVFWWSFEFLNRFVQNWSYMGGRFNAWEYFWYATLPFSTVLPAVLSTRNLIQSSDWLQNGFRQFVTLSCPTPRLLAGCTFIAASGCLIAIGIWPDYFFSLLWTAPLLMVISLQVLLKEPHILQKVPAGDWRDIVGYMGAALICGWFWEMWNLYSFARWTYSVPYVQRFLIFEMPILGYAGYLPFGLECAVVIGIMDRLMGNHIRCVSDD